MVERSLENRNVEPFPCVNFRQKKFFHIKVYTLHYLVLQYVKNILKKLIFDSIEIPETYFSRNHPSGE